LTRVTETLSVPPVSVDRAGSAFGWAGLAALAEGRAVAEDGTDAEGVGGKGLAAGELGAQAPISQIAAASAAQSGFLVQVWFVIMATVPSGLRERLPPPSPSLLNRK
jgi:hypothetical protein